MNDITIKVGTSGKEIYLYGDMFSFKTDVGLYLSSDKFDGTQKYYDFYSKVKSTSAANPPFSGYPVYDYRVYTNNTLSFKLPAFFEPQTLDIIFANDAGYRLASDAKRFGFIKIIS